MRTRKGTERIGTEVKGQRNGTEPVRRRSPDGGKASFQGFLLGYLLGYARLPDIRPCWMLGVFLLWTKRWARHLKVNPERHCRRQPPASRYRIAGRLLSSTPATYFLCDVAGPMRRSVSFGYFYNKPRPSSLPSKATYILLFFLQAGGSSPFHYYDSPQSHRKKGMDHLGLGPWDTTQAHTGQPLLWNSNLESSSFNNIPAAPLGRERSLSTTPFPIHAPIGR